MKSWGWFDDDRTVLAIKRGIQKWQAIVQGRKADSGTIDCALCEEFLKHSCVGCPVYERTGKAGCADAPYETEWAPLIAQGGSRFADTPEKVKAANAVLKFLYECLPPGAADN